SRLPARLLEYGRVQPRIQAVERPKPDRCTRERSLHLTAKLTLGLGLAGHLPARPDARTGKMPCGLDTRVGGQTRAVRRDDRREGRASRLGPGRAVLGAAEA